MKAYPCGCVLPDGPYCEKAKQLWQAEVEQMKQSEIAAAEMGGAFDIEHESTLVHEKAKAYMQHYNISID